MFSKIAFGLAISSIAFCGSAHATYSVSENSRVIFFCRGKVEPDKYLVVEQTQLDQGKFVDEKFGSGSSRPIANVKVIRYSSDKSKSDLKSVLSEGVILRETEATLRRFSHMIYNLDRDDSQHEIMFTYDRNAIEFSSIYWKVIDSDGSLIDEILSLDCQPPLITESSTAEMIEAGRWVEPYKFIIENPWW